MIETMEGVRNADAIAQVPGVGGFYLGASGDLSADLGVTTPHPDVDAAMAKILSVCQARNIACGGTVNAANVAEFMKQGYKITNFRRSRRRSQRRQRGGKARGAEGGREALICNPRSLWTYRSDSFEITLTARLHDDALRLQSRDDG